MGGGGGGVIAPRTLLLALLRQRHWQPYNRFCGEYDRAAARIDEQLVGRWPSRAQFNRWTSGQLKELPFADHCRVLEAMFPGWTAEQLFQPTGTTFPAPPWPTIAGGEMPSMGDMLALVTTGLESADATRVQWAPIYPQQSMASHLDGVGTHVLTGANRIAQRVATLSKLLRLSGRETRQLAALAGNIVDLDLHLNIDIAKDGSAIVSYRHEIFNMTDRPLARLTREIWFVHTTGPLEIRPTTEGSNRVVIQQSATTPNLAKFACKLSPALGPGDCGTVAYVCRGGRFVDEWYWRESIRRHTRHSTIVIRREGAGELKDYSATVETPNGLEHSAADGLLWDNDRGNLVLTLTKDYLNPNQILSMKWETVDDSA